MNDIKNYIKVTKLNKTKNLQSLENGIGYHLGSAVACHNGEGMKFITYLEFPANKVKGNHYHKDKIEHMCIIKENIKAKYYFPTDPNNSYEILLEEGDVVTICPNCAHAYLSEKGCSAIEFSPQKFGNKDVFSIDDRKGVF